MARPVIGNYFKGALCKRCQTSVRYVRNGTCVECTHIRNINKREKPAAEPATGFQAPKSHHSVAPAVFDYYNRSPSARRRSDYLDAKVRQRFAHLLDDTPTESKPLTGGELLRAGLPVGVAAKMAGGQSRQQLQSDFEKRHSENDAIRAALKRVLARLPDLVTIADIIAALPPAVVAPVALPRLTYTIAVILKDLGVGRRVTQSAYNRGAKKIYVLRHARRYAGMRQVDVAAAHTAMVNGDSLDSLKSKGRSRTAGRRKALPRASLGQMEQVAN